MSNDPHKTLFSDSNPEQEFVDLVTAYLEDQASPAEITQLGEELKASEAKRQYFNAICLNVRLISEVISPELENTEVAAIDSKPAGELIIVAENRDDQKPPASSFRQAIRKVGNFISKPTPLSISLAFIVLFSFLTTLALITININKAPDNKSELAKNNSSKTSVATVTELKDCSWSSDGVMPKTDDLLREGDLLSLKKGLLRIEFNSGATANFQGPTRIRIDSSMAITMHSGVSSFDIPQSAVGFKVDTAAAKIVDLGTRFGVTVNENNSTLVHVFKGKVAASSLDSAGDAIKTIDLTKGQAARFTANSATPDRFNANESEFSSLRILGQSHNFDRWKSHVSKLLLDQDLIGYWNFDNQNTSDLSAKANHGKAHGHIQYSSLIPATVGGGKSLNLGGSGNSVRIPNSKSISEMSSMTIAFWMKSPEARISTKHASRVFDKQTDQRTGWKFRNELGTNSFRFNLYSDTLAKKIEVVNTLDGKWHHFAITVDQENCHVYVDGKLARKTSLPTDMKFNSTEDLMIGAATIASLGNRYEFDGYLDEIFIFKKVLSAQQINSFIFP